MEAGSEGVLAVAGTGRHRLGGGKETGGGENDNIGAGFGRGGGGGIERGLGQRGVISGSKRVAWSGMERGGRVINIDRQQAGNMAGEGRRSRKNQNLNRDRV